jgi:peptidoglycan/LPS O-acetylase OafA/YrhL
MIDTSGVARTRRLDSLTGARFIAAGLVFIFHVASIGLFVPGALENSLVTVTKSAGTMGVSFFFVLSGFVLTWSARPTDTYKGFLRRRLVKIYPNHFITLWLAMALFAAAFTPARTVVLNVLLLQSWVPRPGVFLSINGASWSLSCEIFFYALFPLLLRQIRRISESRLWWWAGAVAGLIIVMPVIAKLLPNSPAFDPATAGQLLGGQSIDQMWFLYIFPPIRLLDFMLGILMARIVLSGRWIGLGAGLSALLAVASYALGIFTPMIFTADAVTVVPLALLVSALATADNAGSRTVLARPAARALGDASFAFYLIHGIVLTYMRQLMGSGARPTVIDSVLLSLLALAISLVLAFSMHRLIEMPAVRRWGRARLATASSAPAATAPASDAIQAATGTPSTATAQSTTATQAPETQPSQP